MNVLLLSWLLFYFWSSSHGFLLVASRCEIFPTSKNRSSAGQLFDDNLLQHHGLSGFTSSKQGSSRFGVWDRTVAELILSPSISQSSCESILKSPILRSQVQNPHRHPDTSRPEQSTKAPAQPHASTVSRRDSASARRRTAVASHGW